MPSGCDDRDPWTPRQAWIFQPEMTVSAAESLQKGALAQRPQSASQLLTGQGEAQL